MSTALGGLGSFGMQVLSGFRVKSPVLSFWKVGGWESTACAHHCAQKYSCTLLATQVAVAVLKTSATPRSGYRSTSEVSSQRVQLQNNLQVARHSPTNENSRFLAQLDRGDCHSRLARRGHYG